MRFRLGHYSIMFIAASCLLQTACDSVKYPVCKTDEDCKKDGDGRAIEDYCVNKKCEQCRDDTHCNAASGEYCNEGRCDMRPGWCQGDTDCPAGQVCTDNQCQEMSCTSDQDCQGGMMCEDGLCVEMACMSDQQCGSGERCDNGRCVVSDVSTISANCRPMSPGSGEVVALQTVSFDFDQSSLRVDARQALSQNAECLQQATDVTIVIEGHCDERGTQEYNLALGERRANAVKTYLRNLGIDVSRMKTISKGENSPVCRQASESCWERNRRVEFMQQRSGGF